MGKMTAKPREHGVGMKAMRRQAYLPSTLQLVARRLTEHCWKKIKEEAPCSQVILIAQMHEAVRREEWAAGCWGCVQVRTWFSSTRHPVRRLT
jgi:hypothetical protein